MACRTPVSAVHILRQWRAGGSASAQTRSQKVLVTGTGAYAALARVAARLRGSSLISVPACCSASRSSYKACRFIQNCGLVPNLWAKRNAVSPVIARLPLTIWLMRFSGTRSCRASSVGLLRAPRVHGPESRRVGSVCVPWSTDCRLRVFPLDIRKAQRARADWGRDRAPLACARN
jgi:hypothetical protein